MDPTVPLGFGLGLVSKGQMGILVLEWSFGEFGRGFSTS